MCEATGSDSERALWGEINVTSNLLCADSSWKPINEYPNVIQERNFTSERYQPVNDLASDMEKKEFFYDPVGKHMIQLRQSYYELNKLLLKAEMQREKNKSICSTRKNKTKHKKTRLPNFTIPEFPVNNLSKDSFEASCSKSSKMITSRSFLTESEVKEQITQFVKQVVTENGYYVKDSQTYTPPIRCLSDLTDKFLTGFINLLKFHKNSSSENDDLWSPLETTLYEIKFGGIDGLHKFSSERLSKHDRLQKECEDMLKRYEKLRN